MMRSLAIVALAFLVLTPAATACSYAYPEPFSRLEWPEQRGLLVSRGFDVGALHPSNRTLEIVAEAFPGQRWAVSPDGRWVVSSYGDTQTDPDLRDTCTIGRGSTVALDRASGTTFALADVAAKAMAGNKDGVLLAVDGSDQFLFYEWGTWDAVTFLNTPPGKDSDDTWFHFYGSPTTTDLVVLRPSTDIAYMLRAGAGTYQDFSPPLELGSEWELSTVAWAPDSAHVAVVLKDAMAFHDRPTGYQIRIYDATTGESAAVHAVTDEYADDWGVRRAAWSVSGLAVALPGALRVYDDPVSSSQARLLDPADDLTGGVAWSSSGQRLAFGLAPEGDRTGEIRIVDPALRRITAYQQEELEPAWSAGSGTEVRSDWTDAATQSAPSDEEAFYEIPGPGLVTLLLVLGFVLIRRRR